jgi:hypothetical protein
MFEMTYFALIYTHTCIYIHFICIYSQLHQNVVLGYIRTDIHSANIYQEVVLNQALYQTVKHINKQTNTLDLICLT